MAETPIQPDTPQPAPGGAARVDARRWFIAHVAIVLSWLLWLATFLLICPHPGRTFIGQVEWSEDSLLRPLITLMSLGDIAPTIRGVEIKTLALHLAAAAGLLLVAGRALLSRGALSMRRLAKTPWSAAQLLMSGWVLISLWSMQWSTAPWHAFGQALLYALMLAWAIALAWTLERKHLPRLLGGWVVISVLTAGVTIWYFYERSPNHRPGFPLGNPGVLAIVLTPAILICANLVISSVRRGWRTLPPSDLALSVGALLALVPLVWAFALADALAAKVGLVAGLATLGFWQAGPRARWVAVGVALVLVLGAVGYRFSSSDEFALGRGASARFRLYSWRYAALLWQTRPLVGHGAGAYPRLANELSRPDRELDPAAFMGDFRDHAHNELFEVFAEIGLLGGVTYVAGHLATILVAVQLMQRRLSARRRALLVALLAAYVALLVESLGSVSLRLPGAPAVLFSLMGVIWALGRSAERDEMLSDSIADLADPRARNLLPVRAKRWAMAVGCAAGAIIAAWLGAMNWMAALETRWASDALRDGKAETALHAAQSAEVTLLDPVRRLQTRLLQVDARVQLAEMVTTTLHAANAPDAALVQDALTANQDVYAAAVEMDRLAPNLGDVTASAARAAERLVGIFAAGRNLPQAAVWQRRAMQAWMRQRAYDRYHVDALLALTRYPGSLLQHVVYLRDALRRGRTEDADWRATFARFSQAPNFGQAVSELERNAGPIDPQTDVDAIIASFAPETYRLLAAWSDAQGDPNAAAVLAARAVALYHPLTTRFPTLVAEALHEQAGYQFRADPLMPRIAIDLAQSAIDALPAIQVQQRERLARPMRVALARYLFAAGDQEGAVRQLSRVDAASAAVEAQMLIELVGVYMRYPPDARPAVRQWLLRAIELQPDAAGAWYGLGFLAAEAGDRDDLQQVLDAALVSGVPADTVRDMARRLTATSPAPPSPTDE